MLVSWWSNWLLSVGHCTICVDTLTGISWAPVVTYSSTAYVVGTWPWDRNVYILIIAAFCQCWLGGATLFLCWGLNSTEFFLVNFVHCHTFLMTDRHCLQMQLIGWRYMPTVTVLRDIYFWYILCFALSLLIVNVDYCYVFCRELHNKYISGDWPLSTHADPMHGQHAGRFVWFLASGGAKFPKMWDSLSRMPMSHCVKFSWC